MLVADKKSREDDSPEASIASTLRDFLLDPKKQLFTWDADMDYWESGCIGSVLFFSSMEVTDPRLVYPSADLYVEFTRLETRRTQFYEKHGEPPQYLGPDEVDELDVSWAFSREHIAFTEALFDFKFKAEAFLRLIGEKLGWVQKDTKEIQALFQRKYSAIREWADKPEYPFIRRENKSTTLISITPR